MGGGGGNSIQVWEGAWMWFECDNCGKEVWTNHKLRNHHGNAHNSFSDNCWHTLTLCELTFVVKLSGPHLQKMKRVVKWIRWKFTMKYVADISRLCFANTHPIFKRISFSRFSRFFLFGTELGYIYRVVFIFMCVIKLV